MKNTLSDSQTGGETSETLTLGPNFKGTLNVIILSDPAVTVSETGWLINNRSFFSQFC